MLALLARKGSSAHCDETSGQTTTTDASVHTAPTPNMLTMVRSMLLEYLFEPLSVEEVSVGTKLSKF